jgi:four helix bundle protein
MKNQVSRDIEQRLVVFSVSVIRLTEANKQLLPFSVIDQVIRASGSVGANYAEAQNASSRTDFRNKIFIAKKEAAETRYWLHVITELTGPSKTDELLQEVQEILLILQKITNTLRDKSAT